MLLLLRRTLLLLLLLLRTLRPRSPLLLRLSRTSAALALRLLRLSLLPRGRGTLACPLLEIADLLLHEPLRLPGVFGAHLVEPAVRAPLPSLGIGFLAGGTKDAFWQRHREIGAHCTLRPVDETRRRTLEALLELAGESSPNACWDDRRAVDLLRRQATRAELEELGADERLLAHIYAEER
ncbi:MAG TPA: hypothetical protein VNI54_05935 [Thermoanaerobaculia bacterium]|nr:hypothetical protein [Thermoanaerobaculia bacterium]